MENTSIYFMTFSLVCIVIAGCIKLYEIAYNRGYGHGKHSGFSEGLFKAHEKINHKNKKSISV